MVAVVLSKTIRENFEVVDPKRNSEVQDQNPHGSTFQSHPEMLDKC